LFEAFLSDARFAVRWLRRSPGFTLVAIVSLAIGIGFNTALFTIVDAVLFKPLPVASPERLVDVFTTAHATNYGTSSYPDYLDLQAQNDVFEEMAGYSPMFAALNLDNRSRLAIGEIVTGNYFKTLGVGAALGRVIVPDDDRRDAPRVAMVSYRYWMRELSGSRDAIGRMVRIRGNPYTIVGVAPASFTGMVPVLAPEVWIPVSASLAAEPIGLHDTVPSPGATRLERRGDRWMFIRARLKPGRSAAEAAANVGVLMARLDAANPQTNQARQAVVKPTRDVHFHPAADATILPIAGGLMVVVGLVLLIACANVASMLLARASGRQKEIGIRLAIGASRGRLVRQLLTEAFVMSAFGASLGMLLAWWCTSIVATLNLPLPFPLALNLRIDLRVLAFTAIAMCAAALLAGLAPAVQTSKTNVVTDLRGEPTLARRGGYAWTLRDALVAGQMAVTALLLIVAALLTRTLLAAERTNVGLPVEKLAVVSTDTGMVQYSEGRSRQFFDDAIAHLSAIPGVESAALATRVPFSVNFNRWDIWVPGRHRADEHGDSIDVTTVSPTYFQTIGVPIVAGRAFTDSDRPDTPRVAIVNETFARRYWPGERAVGKTFRSRQSDGPLFEVVGVSADHKVSTIGEPPTPFIEFAITQRPASYTSFIARTRGDADMLLRSMREALLALEPNLVFVENQTMAAEVDATLFPVRVGAWLVTSIGLMAMLLAAVGLYGVIAYSVARRTREIGIRIALGARPGTVLRLVMQQGLFVAAAGLVAGCALAAVAAHLIAGALYGVRPSDPLSWLAAVGVVLGVAALANFIPARRAARVDPSIALRIE
jgi:predicted permease